MNVYNMGSETIEFFGLTPDAVERLGKTAVVHIGYWNNNSHSNRYDHLVRYIQLYVEACLRELQWFSSQSVYADDEVVPILWRCCHTAELSLKAALELKWRLSKGDVVPDLTNTHCLEHLLKKHSEWFGEPFPLSTGTQKFTLKLNELNARQQNRYAFSRKDNMAAWSDQALMSMAMFEKEFQCHVGQITQLVFDLAGELDHQHTP